MREIGLRHHHLLCLRGFVGKGYDRGFVENMARVARELARPEGLLVRLSASCDDICARCPFNSGGECEQPAVMDKDRSAAAFLELPMAGSFPAAELLALVERRIAGLEDMRSICGDCEWAALCNERLGGCVVRGA